MKRFHVRQGKKTNTLLGPHLVGTVTGLVVEDAVTVVCGYVMCNIVLKVLKRNETILLTLRIAKCHRDEHGHCLFVHPRSR